MNLYLLRHGEAESTASSSAGRQLTETGHEEVIRVARQFLTRNLEIDACYVSPALRAKQTAETFLACLHQPPEPVVVDVLSAHCRAAQVMAFLESVTASHILLVSHNPILSELLALLTNGNIDNLYILDTGDLACVTLDMIGLGMGSCPFILSADSAQVPAS